MSAGQVIDISVVMNSSSTLRYLNGDCTWTVTIKLESGSDTFVNTKKDPELVLIGNRGVAEYAFQCEVNDSVKLNAALTVCGELY